MRGIREIRLGVCLPSFRAAEAVDEPHWAKVVVRRAEPYAELVRVAPRFHLREEQVQPAVVRRALAQWRLGVIGAATMPAATIFGRPGRANRQQFYNHIGRSRRTGP